MDKVNCQEICEATSFMQLAKILEQKGGVQSSLGLLKASHLNAYLAEIQKNISETGESDWNLSSFTRNEGLRDKVRELYERDKLRAKRGIFSRCLMKYQAWKFISKYGYSDEQAEKHDEEIDALNSAKLDKELAELYLAAKTQGSLKYLPPEAKLAAKRLGVE